MHRPRLSSWTGAVALTGLLLSPTAAAAQSPDRIDPEPDDPLAHAVSAGVGTGNQRPFSGRVGYRLLLSRTLQLGVELEGAAVDRGYIAGYDVEGGGYGDGRLLVQGTVLRQGPLWLDMRLAAGARYQAGAAPTSAASLTTSSVALDRAFAVVGDLGLIANVEAGPWLTGRLGLLAPVVVQVDPAAGLETTGFLTMGGLAVHVDKHVSLTADGIVGGVFGWDGDGNKLRVGGQLGVRWLIGGDTNAWRAF